MPQHVSVHIHLSFFIFVSVAEWQAHAPDAWWGQTILKQWSLEQRLVYYRAIKEMSGSCRKNPKVTESFLQSRLQAKGEGGVWLATAGFLVSGPLLWRSGYGSGNAVSVNVCQMNLILCPDKRAGPKVPRSLSEVPVLPGRSRAQLAAPLRPGSHTLSSCHLWGSQVLDSTGPQLPQAA